MQYKILEHTADLKIRIYGKTLEELFNNILTAIAEVTKPVLAGPEAPSKKIKIEAENLENLLIDFLSEVIYESDLNNAVYTKIKFKKLTTKEFWNRNQSCYLA